MSEEGNHGEDNGLQMVLPEVEPPAPPSTPPAVSAGPHVLDEWFNKWFPENSGAIDKPIAYLSAQWHHVRAAYEDLKIEVDRYGWNNPG